jgi:uncharacterized protein (DUF885 family)
VTRTVPSDELARAAAQYWEETLRHDPILATSLGDRRWDDRLPDPSPEGREDRRAELRRTLAQAEAIAPSDLVPDDRITRAALVAQVESDLAQLGAGLDEWSVDPLDGPQITALNIQAFQSVDIPDHGMAMVARWMAMGAWLDAHAANLRRGRAAGRVAVRTPVARVVDQLEGILAMGDDALPLLAPARTHHGDWSPADRRAFSEGLARAVREVVRPALVRFRDVLAGEILPAARPDDHPGIHQLAGGQDAYERLIRVHTSLPLSADEIHAAGMVEVERIDEEIRLLGARTLGADRLPEILALLRSDPALHFSTREEVRETAERALSRARAAIPGWFGLIPGTGCVVIPMGEHEEVHSTIAYYRQPAADGSRPGSYYVNTGSPETRPRYEAEVLAFHESIPGHHLQIAISQELTGLPAFRRHLGPTAFVEGWALYTERLSDEMGLYTGDLDRMGVLSFDAWRACRLVVDTGLHTRGWTRRQAIEFMTAHTALAPNNIANEVDRYIVWPGQALGYKVGQLELQRLRRETKVRLGAAFDIRQFHDAVLRHGALGLEALRAVVEADVVTPEEPETIP